MSERSLISKESLATLGEPRSRDWSQTTDDLTLMYTSSEIGSIGLRNMETLEEH